MRTAEKTVNSLRGEGEGEGRYEEEKREEEV